MAILIANTGNKTVQTIANRNALEKKHDGMQVTVLDAIADVNVGIGSAGYQWDEAGLRWVLIWKGSKDELTFRSEAKVLSGGKVTADQYPQNSLVWGATVRDNTGLILRDVEPSVSLKVIDIGTTQFDGETLHYTYAHGSIVANASPIYCGTF